jgi:uncharacterized membrane protein YqjE
MAGPTTQNPRAANEADLLGHLSALGAAKLGYLNARLKLAGIEGKEAAIHGAIILALAVGALIALIFGYFFFIFALVFVIALAFDGDNAWMWVLLGAGVLHLLGGAALALIAKGKFSTPLFPLTLNELQKDQECLNNTTKKN